MVPPPPPPPDECAQRALAAAHLNQRATCTTRGCRHGNTCACRRILPPLPRVWVPQAWYVVAQSIRNISPSPQFSPPISTGGDQIKPHAPPKPLPPPAADAQPCGPHCWQNARPLNTQPPLSSNPLASVPTRRRRSSPPSTTTTAWTPLETSMLQKYFTMFGGDCCRLAPFIATKRCWQVHQRTAELKLSASVEQPAQPEKHDAKRRKKRSTMVMATKRPTDPVAYRRLAHAGEKKPFFDYQPCECVGPCTKECPCLQNEHYCEKYCACFGRCTRMWPGCSCIAKEKCRTKNCKCYAYNRECDPDVCKGYGIFGGF